MTEQLAVDYVTVGAGLAGCVLANPLSADPQSTVCLVEAGPHLDGRRPFWPRGKTLGGSSSSNAMIYTRGHPSDHDLWAALNNRGWSYADVLPHFLRAEHHEAGASAWHGTGGPLNVAPQRSPNRLSRLFVEAAVAAEYPRNGDFNAGTTD